MDIQKERTNGITVAIDFDGSSVTHDFPYVGKDIGSQKVLKRLVENRHKLILWTMRSHKTTDIIDRHGNIPTESIDTLQEAIDWFEDNDIPLYGVNRNPTQDTWTSSEKAYAQLYIDDASLGCPLKYDLNLSLRPFVDWEKVEVLLEKMDLI
jgi:hypothetical protein